MALIKGKSNTQSNFTVLCSINLLPGMVEALIDLDTPEFTIHYKGKEENKNGSEGNF